MRRRSPSPQPPAETGPVSARLELVRSLAEAHRQERGALMPVLHEIVEEFGWIDRADIEVVAEVLNVSVAEVHGVVSFYEDFRTVPPGQQVVALCRAEACQAVGSEALWDDAASVIGPDRIANGEVEIREVFCLGNCALGPSGMIGGQLVGRLTTDRLRELTQQVQA